MPCIGCWGRHCWRDSTGCVWGAPLQGSGGRILSAAPQYLLGTSCVPGHMLQTLGAAALDPPAPSCATTTLEVQIRGPHSDLVSVRPQCNEVPG